MEIAIAQINSIVGNIQANKEKIIEQVGIAQAAGAYLIIFPEMALSGTPVYDLAKNRKFIDDLMLQASEIAEFGETIDILIGLPTENEGEIFNSVFHIQRGEIVNEFSKAMPLSRHEQGFIAGVESENYPTENFLEHIITVRGRKFLVAIGDDIDFINELDCLGKRCDLTAIIHMDACRYSHGVIYDNLMAACDQARQLALPIITVNMTGANADMIYFGASSVINAAGKPILQLKAFEEDFATINTEEIERFKPIPTNKETLKGRSKTIRKAIICGMKDYFQKRGFSQACLGLSGGIDSAVVLALAVEALGKENVDVILMPSQFSSDHSVTDSLEMVKRLGVKHHLVAIEEIYNAYMTPLGGIFEGLPFSVAEENLQSRIRGTLLMTYANKFNRLLLNTTNKSEAAMGYGTLYGDTNGALSVLGDLYKGEVYALARLINEEQEIIPSNIIEKAPSAELRPGQKDSDSLPEYEQLDKILYKLIEEGENSEEVILEGEDRVLVERIAQALNQNEYKRYQLPPTLRLSVATLGKERILPF